MTVEIISWSISTKVWDQAGIKLNTPESAVGLATDCDMGPCTYHVKLEMCPWDTDAPAIAKFL